ncbi:hypothetical protein G4G28_10970 [Massilia sp. Dwa41.01b]|uniref:hypothetical protein n=1 Tax=Massilia sp. Dwa41.01b TaxID=2709302 RepID=UPI00160246CB|nr:hypothetical protein [Massilia sp. Dwa41.01b]QNA88877.1 hypothetical protein G4G28_10970 [Massilia sp. Dwa41.01b]
MFSFRRPALPSIRSKLITLVLASMLPIMLGAIALVRDAGQREQEHVARDAATVTRAPVAALDRELDSAESAARVAAAWPTPAPDSLDRFHEHARQLLRPEFTGHAFVLSGRDGATLLHTRYPYGSAVPAPGNAEEVAAVLRHGDGRTSSLYRSSPDQPGVVSSDVPVWQGGKVAYVLSVQQRPRRVADLLAAQQLPPGWSAEVFDRRGAWSPATTDYSRSAQA